MENEWKSFLNHFFKAFGVVTLCAMMFFYILNSSVCFGQYSLYGFPSIAMVYAFVKMGEAKTKKQNEILKALDEMQAEVKRQKGDGEEENTLDPDDEQVES